MATLLPENSNGNITNNSNGIITDDSNGAGSITDNSSNGVTIDIPNNSNIVTNDSTDISNGVTDGDNIYTTDSENAGSTTDGFTEITTTVNPEFPKSDFKFWNKDQQNIEKNNKNSQNEKPDENNERVAKNSAIKKSGSGGTNINKPHSNDYFDNSEKITLEKSEQNIFPPFNEQSSEISTTENSKKELKVEKIQILNGDFGNEKFLEDDVVVVKNENLTTVTPQAIITSQGNLNFPAKNIEDVIASDNDYSPVALGGLDYSIKDGKRNNTEKLKNHQDTKKLKYLKTHDQFEFF